VDRLVQMSAQETASDVVDVNETGKVLSFRANREATGVDVLERGKRGASGRQTICKSETDGSRRDWVLDVLSPLLTCTRRW